MCFYFRASSLKVLQLADFEFFFSLHEDSGIDVFVVYRRDLYL